MFLLRLIKKILGISRKGENAPLNPSLPHKEKDIALNKPLPPKPQSAIIQEKKTRLSITVGLDADNILQNLNISNPTQSIKHPCFSVTSQLSLEAQPLFRQDQPSAC